MIIIKCYEELGKRCIVKTKNQKIYWDICYFYKRCNWIRVFKKGWINQLINGKYVQGCKLLI